MKPTTTEAKLISMDMSECKLPVADNRPDSFIFYCKYYLMFHPHITGCLDQRKTVHTRLCRQDLENLPKIISVGSAVACLYNA